MNSRNEPPEKNTGGKISALKNRSKITRWAMIFLMAVAIGIFVFMNLAGESKEPAPDEKPTSIFMKDVKDKRVKNITVKSDFLTDFLTVTLTDGQKYVTKIPRLGAENVFMLSDGGVEVDVDKPETDLRSIPSYILTGLLIVVLGQMLLQSTGFSFNRNANTKSTLRFTDIAGNEEAKAAFKDVVNYLKDPSRYEALGAKFPQGIIMDGPPGTGKTALAKAVAGEAEASFIAASGSDFSSMFVGVSGMKVKSLFARARRQAPCVLFIDEIDAIGGRRLSEGTATAREQGSTLNQLLVQMNGFEENRGVIVIAATNRMELLDPALLRSGRFDRHIHMMLPTIQERADILRIHAKKVRLSADFDFDIVARQTMNMSGADLENVINQAALIAVNEGQEEVKTEHALQARNRIFMGEQRQSMADAIDEKTKRVLAIHEAGHAIVAMAHGPDPVSRVSIIPRGQSLGQTMLAPEKETMLHDYDLLFSKICLLLGGRAAEESVAGVKTTGAADDLNKASHIALELVCSHGMTSQGLLRVGDNASDHLKYESEQRAQEILSCAMKQAKDLIAANRRAFDHLVQMLLEHEDVDEKQLLEVRAMLEVELANQKRDSAELIEEYAA